MAENNYGKYFSLYEPTDPPPIKTEGYKRIFKQYRDFISSDNNTSNSYSQDNLNSNLEPLQEYAINRDTKVLDAVNLARKLVGSKYSWGGITPSTGFDNPGLLYYVYNQNGINLPRTTKEMENFGTNVQSFSDVEVGDLIFTPGTGSNKHVQLVSKIQDGQVYTIDAKNKKDGIVETAFNDTSDILSIKRVSKPNNYIVQYFINKGLTKNQAKGIYGNIMQESNGNTRAKSQDGHGSFGLAQWTGDRKKRLFQRYGQNPTAMQQLDFLWWELNNTHRDALESLKRTTTTWDATKVFMDKFERPHKNYANFNRRLKYANSVI